MAASLDAGRAITECVTKSRQPRHRVFVVPWLRRPMRRAVLPNWLAITIGRWIFAWRPLDEAELAHELAHVRQWAHHGVRFIPRYLAASRTAARRGGDRYRDNAFEQEAVKAEQKARER